MDRPPPTSHHSSFQRKTFLLALAVISAGFLYVVRDFVLILFLAAVFTGLSYPLFEWFSRKFRYRAVAAAATILLILVVIVIPLAAIITAAYQQAAEFIAAGGHLRAFAYADEFRSNIKRILPKGLEHLYPGPEKLTGYAERSLSWVGEHAAESAAAVAGMLAKLALMFLFMFYFYLDGPRMLARIVRLSPLPDAYEKTLFHRFLVVGRGAFMGIFVIGAIQGLATGLLFWATGVPSPVFLGLLTMVASVIPAFGAALIWFPAAIFLFFSGHATAGIIVLLVGTFVISVVDNLLRPLVVGKSIQMHDVMVLVSTLGGLVVFGISGFIIGPILAALFLSAWSIFEEMFSKELESNREPKHAKDV
jgi:predicted PurR-regulated permease PerM